MIELADVDIPGSRVPASAVLSCLAAELLREQACWCGEPTLARSHILHQCVEVSSEAKPLEMKIADWNALFSAVEERLKQTAGDRTVIPATPPDPVSRIQLVVLDCVEALDLLHRALTHERARSHQLEQEVASLRAGLRR